MFSVFPNPITSGKVYINTEFNVEKQIQVFDILGKQVMMQTLKGRELNVSSLRSGVYILKVMEDGKTATRKLIIN
ncbi:MAG: T9SS type A sorting domain-containing protein [Flavobacteriaceae bacterium]|nr:T9SS type A sorting domain-containing protein [Flavobacteriaceae bacterium]